jgi:cupin fold WbuC family metalloprotein
VRVKRFNTEVVFASDQLVQIGDAQVARLKAEAGRNARRRMRICAHADSSDLLHEMLIVHVRDTYIRPHKRAGESVHVIEGSAKAVFFHDDGSIWDTASLGEYRSGADFFYRFGGPVYHTLIIRSPVFVFHEATTGPFRREETTWAPWAPDESQAEAVKEFQTALERAVTEFEARRLPPSKDLDTTELW